MRKLLNENEVADLFGLPVRTLQWRRYAGQPPAFIKIGSRVYYRPNVVEEWLASCERTSTSDDGSSSRDGS